MCFCDYHLSRIALSPLQPFRPADACRRRLDVSLIFRFDAAVGDVARMD
jgi:hypothetical protein